MTNSRLIAEFINHVEFFDVNWNENKNEIDFHIVSRNLFSSPNETVKKALERNDNQLTSLKHAPRFIQNGFNCEGNLFNPLMENEIKNMIVGDVINFSVKSDTNNDLSDYVVTRFKQ